MRKTYHLLLSAIMLFAYSSLSHSQTHSNTGRNPTQGKQSQDIDENWYLGQEMSIHSTVLDEERHFRIGLPKSYKNGKQQYPVVYLLDGDSYYFAAAGAVRALSSQGMMPEAIIVAVYNPQRQYDLSPPDMDIPTVREKRGEKFLDYLETELVPFINQQYRTLPLNVLFGHSHGGIFGLYALAKSPGLFRFQIALDAPVHLGDRYLEKGLEQRFGKMPAQAGRLIVGWNRYAWTREMETWLSGKENKLFSVKTIDMVGETHASMYYPGIYQGLQALFSDHEYKHTKTLSFEELEQRYRSMNTAYGYEIPIPAWALRYGALDHLVAADGNAARPFVEAMERLYQSSEIMGDNGREWLNELETNPPKESRAQFLARPDASAEEAKPFLGTWRGGAYEIKIKVSNGKLTGIITQTFPGDEQQIVRASKMTIMEDGSLYLTYENMMPPRTGLIYFQLKKVNHDTTRVEQGFRVYWPSMEARNRPQRFEMVRD